MNKKIAIITFLLIFLASCASPAAPQPTVTSISSPTQTASATPTATPEPTSTVTPTPTIAVPEHPADFGPEHNPQMFQHNGMWWQRTLNGADKYVWTAVNVDGTPVEGMEYVTMEHFDLYLGNAHMFMVAYNLGDFHILVSPELQARLDFSKSGKTPEAIGQELRTALAAKATDKDIIAKINAGAPLYAVLGEKEDVWHMPCSTSSVFKLAPIQSSDGSLTGQYICKDNTGVRQTGPLEESNGSIDFGFYLLKRDFSTINAIKPSSLEYSTITQSSPLVAIASAILKGALSESWFDVYGSNGGGKLLKEYTAILNNLIDVNWVE